MPTPLFSSACRHIFRVLAGSLFLLSAQAAHANDAAIQRGRAIYMQHQCYSCHGTMGQGGERNAGPRIAPNPFPFVAFEMQLRQPRGVMPRYSVQAIDAQGLQDVYAFVASIPAPPPLAGIPLLRDAMK